MSQTSAPDDTTREAPAEAGASRAVKHPVTARTKARRRAIEILFEADQRGLMEPGELRALAAERAIHSANHTEAPAYTREVLAGIADHLERVDEVIGTYAQGWALGRMPAVDRAIARMATWEILFNDDVDVPVSLDEAQTLAKMLSTDDSPRYLGGVLGRIGDLAHTLR